MKIDEFLKASGLTEKQISERVAVCDLLPDHEECQIEIGWKVIQPGKIREIVRRGEREFKLAKKSGKLLVHPHEPEWEEQDFTGRLLAEECVAYVRGLTPHAIRAYGLLPLTPEQVEAMDATCKASGKTLDEIEGFLDLLARQSRPYRARLFELQNTSKVVEAEDALRKKASSASSSTSGNEAA